MQRDVIDFKDGSIVKTFRKIFIPTVLGLISSAVINITDGIFLGQGVGAIALASVNIVAPLYMISAGVGLMFGMGASVVASVHLALGRIKAANSNITQAIVVSVLLMIFLSVIILLFNRQVASLFGASNELMPHVLAYMNIIAPVLVFNMLGCMGLFIIRLDGAPRYAMWCTATAAIVNLVLDYIFIFPLGLGIAGAAWVTVIALTVEACMIFYYLVFRSRTVRLYKLKLTVKSIRLTIRNVWYQIKLGISGLLGEGAIGFMMIIGNLVFIRNLGEEGIAAFSVACYCLPIIFMLNAAISQSAQPIISFNHGMNNWKRVHDSSKLALVTAVFSGLIIFAIMSLGVSIVVGLFLDSNTGPFEIAISGIPLFAIAYPFFAFNVVAIGNYQSIERGNRATIYTLLRGFIFMPLFFILLPRLFGTPGIWLSVPCAEILTTIIIICFYYRKKSITKFSTGNTKIGSHIRELTNK